MNLAEAFARSVYNSWKERITGDNYFTSSADDLGPHSLEDRELSPVQRVAYDGYTDKVCESNEIPSQVDFLEKRCYRLSKKLDNYKREVTRLRRACHDAIEMSNHLSTSNRFVSSTDEVTPADIKKTLRDALYGDNDDDI